MDLRQPRKKKSNTLRNTLVILGAIVVTSLGVNATDNLGRLSESLLGSAVEGVLPQSVCEEGMVSVSSSNGDFCIDEFEVSAGPGCSHQNPRSVQETHVNLQERSCMPESKEGSEPWTHISHNQAIEACARAGKHLPSNEEWFLASLGTPDGLVRPGANDCNISRNWGGGKGKTGTGVNCKSSWGSYDMIGNVWEWTLETVREGSYKNIELPDAGFVHEVNEEGIPTQTQNAPNNLYFDDRFWVDKNNTTAIFRGGFFGNGTDAGRFSVHSEIPASFTGEAVGFRCAK